MKQVVVGIISKEEDTKKYLLVSSKKDFGKYTGFYYPPGGHLEPGEDEISALRREVEQEVGLKITNQKKITESQGDVPDQITHWYLCEVESYDISINNEELADADYFSKEAIEIIDIWPATLKVFKEYIF